MELLLDYRQAEVCVYSNHSHSLEKVLSDSEFYDFVWLPIEKLEHDLSSFYFKHRGWSYCTILSYL